MDWSATYDFLLVFHSNYGSILYRFRDKGQYLQNFLTPVHLTSPLRGQATPWNFVMAVGSKELEWSPYQNVKKYDGLSIHSDTVPELDRLTDWNGNRISHSACIACWLAIKIGYALARVVRQGSINAGSRSWSRSLTVSSQVTRHITRKIKLEVVRK